MTLDVFHAALDCCDIPHNYPFLLHSSEQYYKLGGLGGCSFFPSNMRHVVLGYMSPAKKNNKKLSLAYYQMYKI